VSLHSPYLCCCINSFQKLWDNEVPVAREGGESAGDELRDEGDALLRRPVGLVDGKGHTKSSFFSFPQQCYRGCSPKKNLKQKTAVTDLKIFNMSTYTGEERCSTH